MAERDEASFKRALELLWSLGEPPARGPKPSLSLDRIVEVAIAIADRSGLAALSMRHIADELGFSPMSLYRHVPGKRELIELMSDVAIGKPPAPRPGAHWRDELATWARANLALHHAHPWLLERELSGPPFGPNHLHWLDAALHALAGLDVAADEMTSLVLTLDNYVRGSARIHVGMAREQQRKHKTAHELDQVYARIFEQVATTERYPMIARALAAGMFTPSDPPRDEFEFGLARVLDGIEARVRGLAGVAGPT